MLCHEDRAGPTGMLRVSGDNELPAKEHVLGEAGALATALGSRGRGDARNRRVSKFPEIFWVSV